MKLDIDILEGILEKYGSKKALMVMGAMWLVAGVVIPEDVLWLTAFKIGTIGVLGIVGAFCQWRLDMQERLEQKGKCNGKEMDVNVGGGDTSIATDVPDAGQGG